jgi:TP901 family phage tail tape measure protein
MAQDLNQLLNILKQVREQANLSGEAIKKLDSIAPRIQNVNKGGKNFFNEDVSGSNQITNLSETYKLVSSLSKSAGMSDLAKDAERFAAAMERAARISKALEESGLGELFLTNRSSGAFAGEYVPETGHERSAKRGGQIGMTMTGLTANEDRSINTVVHEIAHKLDEALRKANLNARGQVMLEQVGGNVFDPSMEEPRLYKEPYAKLLSSLKVTGEKEAANMRLEGLYNYTPTSQLEDTVKYRTSAHEVFARNFSGYNTTGNTENPELDSLIQEITNSLPKAFDEALTKIREELWQFVKDNPISQLGYIQNDTQLEHLGLAQRLEPDQVNTGWVQGNPVDPRSHSGYRDPKTGKYMSKAAGEALAAQVAAAVENIVPDALNIDATAATADTKRKAGMPNFGGKTAGEVIDWKGQESAREDLNILIAKIREAGKEAGASATHISTLVAELRKTAKTGTIQEVKDHVNRINAEIEKIGADNTQRILREANEQTIRNLEAGIAKRQKQAEQSRVLNPEQFQSWSQNPIHAKAAGNINEFIPKDPNQIIGAPTTKVTTEWSNGIQKVVTQYKNADGAIYQLNQTLNRHGDVLNDTQRRFRTFGDAIVRDIVEVTKWSIAVGVVYGPMRKLNELVQISIDNQSKLADIIIASGKAQEDANQVFTDAADIADKTGESLNGVIEGYALAYRATGNIKDETERTVMANKLLTDSLVLAKLAGLNQAEALDTLTASLRQTGQGLDQGGNLLDKWVKTTKSANVDLSTLAHGFAIVGDAAESAGITTDQLNGILATVAETGVGSATEVANATRALISGFQSDQAQKVLSQYGISVKTATGEMRPFLEIMQELSDLKIGKVLSDSDMSKITLALGGGTRRQAAYSAFIENFGRIGEVAKESSKAAGDAESAMAIKLDTVKTSVTQLGNAFQRLAQDLGTKGGILDVIQVINLALAGLVKGLGSVVGALGKAGPMLAIIGAIGLYNKAKGGGLKLDQDLFGNTLARVFPSMSQPSGQYRGIGNTTEEMTRGVALQQRLGAGIKNNWGLIGGIGMSAFSGIQTGASGDLTKGAAEFGVGAAGALVGNLILPGVGGIVGSALGTAIADGIVAGMRYKGPEITDIFRESFVTPSYEGEVTPEQKNVNLEAARKIAIKGAYGSESKMWWGEKSIFRGPVDWMEQLPGPESNFTRNIKPEEVSKYLSTLGDKSKQLVMQKPDEYQKLIAIYVRTLIETGNNAALEEFKKLFRDPVNIDVAAKMDESSKLFVEEYGTRLTDIAATQTKKILEQLSKGEITSSQANTAMVNLGGLTAKAANWLPALGGRLGGTTESQMDLVGNVTANGPEELQNQVTVWIQTAETMKQRLAEANDSLTKLGDNPFFSGLIGKFTAIADANKDWNLYLDLAASLLKEINKEIEISRQGAQTVDFSKYSYTDAQSYEAAARKKYQQQLIAQRDVSQTDDFTQTTVDAKMNDKVMVLVKDMFGNLTPLETLTGVVPLLSSMDEELIKQTGIMVKEGLPFNPMDTTTAQWNTAMGQYPAFLQKLVGAGYKPDTEEQIVKLSDSDIFRTNVDMKIMQYLLGQIADNTKKQLEGVYNMPEGASFWFPSSAIPYLQAAAGGNSGLTPDDGGVITAAINNSTIGMTTNPDVKNPLSMISDWITNLMKPYGPTKDEFFGGNVGQTKNPDVTNPATSTWNPLGTGTVPVTNLPTAQANAAQLLGQYMPGVFPGNVPTPPSTPSTPTSPSTPPPSGVAPTEEKSWLDRIKEFMQNRQETSMSDQGMSRMGWKEDVKNLAQGIDKLFGGKDDKTDLYSHDAALRGAPVRDMPTAEERAAREAALAGQTASSPSGPKIAGDSEIAGTGSWLSGIISSMESSLAPLANLFAGNGRPYTNTPPPSGVASDVKDLLKTNDSAKPSVINFKLNIQSTTQLIVDGRTLASIIKPYLSEDMFNTNGTSGSITAYRAI